MRIRHVLPQPAMGSLPRDPLNAAITGVVNTAWNLAVQQADRWHHVEVVAPGDQRGVRVEKIARVTVYWLPQWLMWRTRRYDFSNLLPLWFFTMKAEPVDITHVHGNPFFLIRSGSRRRILHYHNSPVRASPRYDHAVARADLVICCSEFIRKQFLKQVAYSESQVRVVHNGVNPTSFRFVSRAEARAALNIQGEQPVILYVGRISEEKGLHILLDALEQIAAKSETMPLLLVVGSGTLGFERYAPAWQALQAYEQRMRERASRLPVRFLGNVPHRDLPRLYHAADVFVCPSIYQEPFGMVNIEAAAAGLPTVASAVGGIPEAVIHEQTGILVPPGDANTLADALSQLLTNDALRRHFGQAALAFAARHDWRTLNDEVMSIYDGVLAQESRQRSSQAEVTS